MKKIIIAGQCIGVGLWLIIIYKVLIRSDMIQSIERVLPPKEAGLLSGLLLGDTGGQLTKEIKNSGILHLVVVSGTNVMLTVRLTIELLAGFLGRKKTIVLGLITAWGYTAMVGWQIPILRAVWMVTGLYWSQLLGRKFYPGRFLILTIGMMLLVDFRMIREMSFWLTMLAFIGVLSFKDKEGGIRGMLRESVWITAWVVPVLSLYTGKFNLIGPITTLFLVEVCSWATILGFVATIGEGWTWWLTYPLLKYGVGIMEAIGRYDWNVEFKFNWLIVMGWYLVLIGLGEKYEKKIA